MAGTGALILVATPIGNLGDLSPRAVETLSRADVIAAEDTRRTRALLTHFGIPGGGRLRAVHAHNERVRSCLDADLPVEVVPGPSAALTALVLSGLPAGRFVFEGFLPRKGSARAERLTTIATESRTTVLFEAPTRMAATLADLATTCGPDRSVAVARELTKVHEEVVRGTLAEARARAEDSDARGEHVIVVGPAPITEVSDDEVAAAAADALLRGMSARDAADDVATRLAVPRRRAYDAVLATRHARPE